LPASWPEDPDEPDDELDEPEDPDDELDEPEDPDELEDPEELPELELDELVGFESSEQATSETEQSTRNTFRIMSERLSATEHQINTVLGLC
jgi:hypothetical protein